MSNVVKPAFGTPKKVSKDQFKDMLIELINDRGFSVSGHLRRDHPERNISYGMIDKCLRLGTVQTDPYMNRFGNWQSEVYRHLAGEPLTVVVAIDWGAKVIVVTAYQ